MLWASAKGQISAQARWHKESQRPVAHVKQKPVPCWSFPSHQAEPGASLCLICKLGVILPS